MQPVDFFTMPRSGQDRLLGAMRGQYAPTPLLQTLREPHLGAMPWIAALVTVLGVLLTFFIGFGNFTNSLLRLGPAAIGTLFGILFVGILVVVFALARRSRLRALPYPMGTFLFGGGILDARAHPLRYFPIDLLQNVRTEGSALLVAMPGETFSFACESAIAAQNWVFDVQRARDTAAVTPANERVAVDPLVVPQFDNPIGPREPLAWQVSSWARTPWLAPLLLASTLAPCVWFARNMLSDRLGARRAEAVGSSAALRAYLAVGSSDVARIEREVLPKAELAEVENRGATSELLAFADAHKRSAIDDEIRAAVARAYKREFDNARDKHSLAALLEFDAKFPQHTIKSELKTALHGLFLEAFQKTAKTPLSDPWLDKTFRYAEGRPIPIPVWVQFDPSGKGFDSVDKALARVPEFSGELSMPSHYFGESAENAKNTKRSDLLTALLAKRIDPTFVRFRRALPSDGPQPVPPCLVVKVRPDWSGLAMASKKPRGVLVGVVYHYQVTLRLPGSDPAVTWSFPHKGTPNLPREGVAPIEPAIYTRLSDEADAAFVAAWDRAMFAF